MSVDMITETPEGLLACVLRDLLSTTIAPPRLDGTGEWRDPISFAFWIIERLTPGTYVQLGLGDGEAYSAFCQAAQRCSLSSAYYGVESLHGGDVPLRDESGYQAFARHHDQAYGSFSRLMRSSFEEALAHFPDRSIDLLHIHGQRDVVERHLEMWLPKLTDRAVVLLRNVDSEEEQTGRLQRLAGLWQGSADRPLFFDFGHGFGMLIIGRDVPNVFRQMARLQGDDAALVRIAFQLCGRRVASRLSESKLRGEAKKMEEALESALGRLDSAREQLWQAEIERRRLEVESCKAEVRLAERVAISMHTSAEKDRLIARLQNEKRAIDNELTALRQEHEVVMRSRSMAITKPMRTLVDIARRVRR
jgi:hypothetical protein